MNSQKRSVDRELALDEFWSHHLVNDEPTPEEAAVCSDLLESILATSAKPLHQEIILLKLQHYTNAEISQQLGRTERTVYRVLNRVRKQLQEMDMECEVV